ncbi:hypothetical protein DICVIV_04760 [Dictyocaulus viviparus]|uniref:Uncharacterized protein n=1 Tax=Dictyocaulus viviparus TaxID=29172 RepID=A0A0D8XX94_DICVI|nr:hypothetical protein DICVIV_04760 [Dictyocaulus viviparus]
MANITRSISFSCSHFFYNSSNISEAIRNTSKKDELHVEQDKSQVVNIWERVKYFCFICDFVFIVKRLLHCLGKKWKEWDYSWEEQLALVMNRTGVNAVILELAVTHDPANSSYSIIEANYLAYYLLISLLLII